MPGANCAFPGCSTSRYLKYKGISIFKLPSREGEFYMKWKNNILAVLSQYREKDNNLKQNILAGNVSFCEQHFAKEDIEYTRKYKIKLSCLVNCIMFM